MNLYAVWPYFLLMTLVVGAASSPMFRFVDSADAAPSHTARYGAIDGLRGFLALGVFVFHLVVTQQFITTGRWQAPPDGFYAMLGPVGVSLFFMITGFLFWGKMLRAKGHPSWMALYVGRLFRIAPMYLLVVFAMLYLVFLRTGFQLREPVSQVLAAVLQWLALGLINTQPDVNGYAASHVLAGVTWTIMYEWFFYLSLMLTAYFARGRRHLIFIAAALALCLAGKMLFKIDSLGFSVLFLIGMLVASVMHTCKPVRLSDTVSSSLAFGCLAIIFMGTGTPYGSINALLLALFFYLVCSGSTLFGLLQSKSAQRLGKISYSLYLMQGLVLSMVFAIEPIRAFAMASPQAYWLTGTGCALLLLASAGLGYVLIEQPGIAIGKYLIRRRVADQPQRIEKLLAVKAANDGLKMPMAPVVAPTGTVT
jgi:peptidoglycan/LPS O-acetylase OafA/YrhL